SHERISQQGRIVGRRLDFRKAAVVAAAFAAWTVVGESTRAQTGLLSPNAPSTTSKQERLQPAQTQAATNRLSARAEVVLGASPASKGQWGLLIVDAASGETLYERNADQYFVAASNMKLFTTALALAKLGPDFRFHTTIETH